MNTSDAPEPAFEQLRPMLDDAMADLAANEREVVLLRFFSGRSFAEIGGVLQVSEEAARKRVDRALDKLRDSLARRGYASTAAVLGGALSAHAAPALSPAVVTTIVTGACEHLAAGGTLPMALFMSSTKTIAVAAGMLVLAGGILWSDHHALQRADDARATAETEVAGAAARVTQLTADLAAANRQQAAAEKLAAEKASRGPTSVAPSYLSNPAYRDLSRATSTARRRLEFQRLYRQLQLTPEQFDRIVAIMVRQDDARLDAEIVRAEGGDEQAVYQRSGAEWSQAMRELLGEDGFNQLQEYLRSMPVRAFIDRFAVRTTVIGAPLTFEQSDQLATLALANDFLFQQGKGTDPGTVNWGAVWDPAAKLLNPDQIALLQRMVEVWALQKQMALQRKAVVAQHP